MLRLLSYRWVQITLLLSLLIVALMTRRAEPDIVLRLRHLTFDFYNQISPRPLSNQVVIIDIDEESLQKYGQWPWPRPIVAKIPVMLRNMGAKVVAFDMVFAEPDRTSPAQLAMQLPDNMQDIKVKLQNLPDNDAVFAEMIKKAGHVVTGFVATDKKATQAPALKTKWEQTSWDPSADPRNFMIWWKNYATNLPVISEASDGNGGFNPLQDQDGIIRRVPLITGLYSEQDGRVVKKYPALAIEALRVALGKESIKIKNLGLKDSAIPGIEAINIGPYSIPTDRTGQAWVYFSGHRKSRYIPAWRILENKIPPERIQNKVVLVGTSAIGLKDLRATPLGDTSIPGVDIHAELIEQILQNRHLQRPDFIDGMEIYTTVAVCLLMIFLLPFVGAITLFIIGIFMFWAGFLVSIYAYNTYGYLIDPVYPAATILVIYLAASLLSSLRSEVEKGAVRAAFSHYISPELMEELTQSPDKLKLGGENRELTIMFTDIRNFTSISEEMSPEEVITLMNDFLTPMTDKVLQKRGTIDKYIGDAMMAFWNAPLDDEHHARHACETALHMHDVLTPVNQALKERREKDGRNFKELKAGIGINTGPCSVGNMGSKQRFAYSAMGDAVNLAARLESQTKTYGVPIIIGETTQQQITDFACLELDLIQVKGRTEPERIFYLYGDSDTAQTDLFQSLRKEQSRLLEAYRVQNFDAALDILEVCKNLGNTGLETYYALFQKRIRSYKKKNPGPDWTGVYIAHTK